MQDAHWNFILAHQDEIRGVVRSVTNDDVDEIISDCVYDVVAKYYYQYDAQQNKDLKQWLFHYLRLSVFKYVARNTVAQVNRKEQTALQRRGEFTKESTHEIDALIARLAVLDVTGKLDDYEWQIIWLKYGLEWRYSDMAEYYNTPASTLRHDVNEVIERLRDSHSDLIQDD